MSTTSIAVTVTVTVTSEGCSLYGFALCIPISPAYMRESSGGGAPVINQCAPFSSSVYNDKYQNVLGHSLSSRARRDMFPSPTPSIAPPVMNAHCTADTLGFAMDASRNFGNAARFLSRTVTTMGGVSSVYPRRLPDSNMDAAMTTLNDVTAKIASEANALQELLRQTFEVPVPQCSCAACDFNRSAVLRPLGRRTVRRNDVRADKAEPSSDAGAKPKRSNGTTPPPSSDTQPPPPPSEYAMVLGSGSVNHHLFAGGAQTVTAHCGPHTVQLRNGTGMTVTDIDDEMARASFSNQ